MNNALISFLTNDMEAMQQSMQNTFRIASIMTTIVPFIFVGVFLAVIALIIRAAISQGKHTKRVFDLAETAVQQRIQPAQRERALEDRTDDLLPLIVEDFPGFSWEEIRAKTKNAIRAVLLARTTADPSLLPEEASEELKKKLDLELADDKAGGAVPKFGDIEPGNGVISAYARRNGFCVVTVQVGVRCRKWSEQQGRLVSGSRERAVDTVFSAELILVKDAARAAEYGYSLTCSGCGGQISNLKLSACEYCGRPLPTANLWQFGEIRELQ